MIDLTKLKALELPTEEIEIEILGEKQKITISAMGDDISLDFRDIRKENEIYEVKQRKYVLVRCAGFTEDQADILCARAGEVAAVIIGRILDLTDKFDKEREKITEEAKKKVSAVAVTDTAK